MEKSLFDIMETILAEAELLTDPEGGLEPRRLQPGENERQWSQNIGKRILGVIDDYKATWPVYPKSKRS